MVRLLRHDQTVSVLSYFLGFKEPGFSCPVQPPLLSNSRGCAIALRPSFLSLHSAPYKVPPFFHSFTSPCSPLLHFSVFYSSLLSTSLLSSQLLCSNTLPSLSSLLLSLLLSIYPARQTADPTPKWNAELIAFHLPFIPFLFLSFPPQIGPSERRFKKKKRA